MDKTRITAALGLLKKKHPDLQSTEFTGKDGGPIAAVAIVTSDPTEASKAYSELIKGS